MTLLTVVKDVCAAVGVLMPSTIFANIASNRTMQEMLSLANEMAQRIAYDVREWRDLTKTAIYTGDGTTKAFNRPSDYKRMLLTANLWRSTSALMPMRFVPDVDEWLNRRANNYTDAYGEWTTLGGQIQIAPTMPVGQSAYHAYLNKNCVTLAAGGVGDSFVADGDSYVLNERLLKLGMIWQWKANKASAYAEDLGTYEDALAFLARADTPAPIIIGRKPASANVRVAYPWPVPT